jgi:hypothetical protein
MASTQEQSDQASVPSMPSMLAPPQHLQPRHLLDFPFFRPPCAVCHTKQPLESYPDFKVG